MNETVKNMSEEKLIVTIDRYLKRVNKYEENLTNKRRRELLKQTIKEYEADIALSEYCLEFSKNEKSISGYRERINMDKIFIREVKDYIASLPKEKIKLFRGKHGRK